MRHIVSNCFSKLQKQRRPSDIYRRRACGPFETALQSNFSTDPSVGAYDYCADWQDDDFYTGCINCLLAEDDDYLANMLVLLQVGCDQRPGPGSTVAVSGSLFSTTLLTEASPSPTSTWTNPTDTGPLSLGAKVGIAIGALCLLLVAAGVFIVCNGRRRRRAFLRKLEMRQKDAGSGWPHPSYADRGQGGGSHGIMSTRGPDMNETPLSQKPLRGWDDSPQSATASEPSSYARYFSPYASQQTSPVNGATQMHAHQWPQEFHDEHTYGAGFPSSSFTAAAEHPMPDHSFPSAAQEKTAMDQHAAAMAAGTANAPLHIGLALGGDEPSLRSKLSGVSSAQQEEEADGGGEAYELHEVSSSAGGSSAGGMNHSAGGVVAGSSQSFRNRVARENRTPVLQHPGYGRYSPERELPPPPPPPVHSIMDEGNRI